MKNHIIKHKKSLSSALKKFNFSPKLKIKKLNFFDQNKEKLDKLKADYNLKNLLFLQLKEKKKRPNSSQKYLKSDFFIYNKKIIYSSYINVMNNKTRFIEEKKETLLKNKLIIWADKKINLFQHQINYILNDNYFKQFGMIITNDIKLLIYELMEKNNEIVYVILSDDFFIDYINEIEKINLKCKPVITIFTSKSTCEFFKNKKINDSDIINNFTQNIFNKLGDEQYNKGKFHYNLLDVMEFIKNYDIKYKNNNIDNNNQNYNSENDNIDNKKINNNNFNNLKKNNFEEEKNNVCNSKNKNNNDNNLKTIKKSITNDKFNNKFNIQTLENFNKENNLKNNNKKDKNENISKNNENNKNNIENKKNNKINDDEFVNFNEKNLNKEENKQNNYNTNLTENNQNKKEKSTIKKVSKKKNGFEQVFENVINQIIEKNNNNNQENNKNNDENEIKNNNIDININNDDDKQYNYSNPKDIIDIEKIRNYIKSMPSRTELTLSETIAKLKSIIKENNLIQEEIAFLSFCWMAENVTYADKELHQGKRIDCSAEGMYKNGKSVCAGFSNLYNYLNTQLGIETVDISGYAKGAGYVPGERYNSNHAWNGIKLRNKWYLLDSTWGEGHAYRDTYVKEFKPFYFCTPPKYFIYQHFPENEKWQLLDKPISQKEYIDMIKLKNDFFTYGFTDVIPNKSVAKIYNNQYNLKVYFEKEKNIHIKINLYFEKNKDENIGEKYCKVEKKDNYFDIIFNLPKKGLYNVILFGSDSKSSFFIQYTDIGEFNIEYK